MKKLRKVTLFIRNANVSISLSKLFISKLYRLAIKTQQDCYIFVTISKYLCIFVKKFTTIIINKKSNLSMKKLNVFLLLSLVIAGFMSMSMLAMMTIK